MESSTVGVIPLHEPRGMGEHVTGYLKKVVAITEMEVQKLLHDQWDIFTRSIQPVLWLILFGGVFGRLRILPEGMGSYLDFVTPGILAQSVMTISIFQGITLIWERDQGTLQKYLVSPMPRSALVLGKGIGAGVRGTIQALTISILALFMGVHLEWNPLTWLGVIVFIFLGAIFFSTLSLLIAALVRNRERVQGLGQLIMMPLFFASNALYPVTIMPAYVEALARFNPLSYMVDGLRELMVGTPGHFGLGMNLVVLVAANAFFVWLAARVFPRVVH
ncbi:MAG TPA: ABC transporter permease [Chloroflexia bacterium]|nr:ABC transporter permease [Chloroflexia bacterium]